MDGVMGNKKQESSKSKSGGKTPRKVPFRHNRTAHTEAHRNCDSMHRACTGSNFEGTEG